jgi:hypothetical protein
MKEERQAIKVSFFIIYGFIYTIFAKMVPNEDLEVFSMVFTNRSEELLFWKY